MSENSGASFIKSLAAVGGGAVGWSLGATIASGWEVSTDSFLGRSAQNGMPLGGLVLQYGLAIVAAIVTYILVKKVVDR